MTLSKEYGIRACGLFYSVSLRFWLYGYKKTVCDNARILLGGVTLCTYTNGEEERIMTIEETIQNVETCMHNYRQALQMMDAVQDIDDVGFWRESAREWASLAAENSKRLGTKAVLKTVEIQFK